MAAAVEGQYLPILGIYLKTRSKPQQSSRLAGRIITWLSFSAWLDCMLICWLEASEVAG